MRIKYRSSSIGSVSALASALSVSEGLLKSISNTPSSYYRIYEVPKRSGGFRVISDPLRDLKVVQRRIVRRIFCHTIFPDYLYGSVRDEQNPRDFLRNAQYHSEAKMVVSFDIDSFFPSVRPPLVKEVFKYLMKFPDDVSNLLVELTTLNNGLPQGAPTSPYLANLVFWDEEHKVVNELRSKGFLYSRLVDDIVVSSKKDISSEHKSYIYKKIQGLLRLKNLSVNKEKYKVTSTLAGGSKTVVTGLELVSGKVNLSKAAIKKIGGLVYNLEKRAIVSTQDHDYHKDYARASGLVALYSRVDDVKSVSYRKVLRNIYPTYSQDRVKKIAYLCRRFVRYAKSHKNELLKEGYTRKYHRFVNKVAIIKRTNRKVACELVAQLSDVKPVYRVGFFNE